MSDDTEGNDKRLDDQALGIEERVSAEGSVVEVERAPIRKRKPYRKFARKPTELTERERANIVSMRAKGVEIRTLAQKYSLNEASLGKFLKTWEPLATELQQGEDYRANRADLLSAAHARLLKYALKEGKLEEAPLSQIATALDKVYKHERLERGLSTDNQAIRSFSSKPKSSDEGDR